MRSISKHEGERAVTFGWIEQWEKLESGETKVLLTQVSVRGHDRQWEEKLDHLWAYTPSDWWDRSDLKRLDATAFCGTVFQYRRANGTIDYGVKRDFWATPWSKYAGHCTGSDRISWEKRKQILEEAVIFEILTGITQRLFRCFSGNCSWKENELN